MNRFLSIPLAAFAVLAAVSPARADDGSAPMRFKNSTDRPVYFCCDNTGRGATKSATMDDGRPGTLVQPGCTARIPETNVGDVPTFRVYNADKKEICSQRYGLLIVVVGCPWEVKYTGERIVSDD